MLAPAVEAARGAVAASSHRLFDRILFIVVLLSCEVPRGRGQERPCGEFELESARLIVQRSADYGGCPSAMTTAVPAGRGELNPAEPLLNGLGIWVDERTCQFP